MKALWHVMASPPKENGEKGRKLSKKKTRKNADIHRYIFPSCSSIYMIFFFFTPAPYALNSRPPHKGRLRPTTKRRHKTTISRGILIRTSDPFLGGNEKGERKRRRKRRVFAPRRRIRNTKGERNRDKVKTDIYRSGKRGK